MMLQGHFIDTFLDASYKDYSNISFKIWNYFRGITAPIFFTISGLIFSYLLITAKHKGILKKRISKGLIRGLLLIGIGYILRIPISIIFTGEFHNYYFVVDVLQSIGLSIICIVFFYKITFKKTLIFSLLMLIIGVSIFVTEPLYRTINTENLPLFFSNYITQKNGSVFTFLPWFGYMAFGAFISTIFYRYLKYEKFKIYTVIGFLITGVILINFSSLILMKLFFLTDIQIFNSSANYNYLFTRLGNVLIILALFYSFERFLKFPLILKIGQKTLSIYVIHFIIIYGSFTGYGLNKIISKTLTPWQAIISAIIFLITVCFISFYYVKTNAFIYSKLREIKANKS